MPAVPPQHMPVSHLFRVLKQTVKGSRGYYLAASLSVLGVSAFSYLIPLVFRFAIDTVIDQRAFSLPFKLKTIPADGPWALWLRDHLWGCGVIMLILAAGQGLFDYCRAWFSATASESFARRLRKRLFNHVNHLPFQTLTQLETGDLIQRCTSDVDTTRQFFESQLIEITRILVMISLAIPVMLFLDPFMTFFATILLPLVIAGSILYFGKVRRSHKKVAESEARLSTVLQEDLTGMRLVKAFSREDFETRRFQSANEDFRDTSLAMMRMVSVYWGGSAFLCMGQICLVLAVGAYRASEGLLSVGTLTVFISYVYMLVWPIRMLGHVLSDAGRAHVSLSRIVEVLEKPVEPSEPDTVRPDIKGAVEFRAVSFAYEKNCPALKDITFSVPAGATVGILGKTGSGKSTLVHLLPRLLEYSGGSILIDGHELRNIAREHIRSAIGTVLQEPFLYSRSIRENIMLADHAEDDEESAEHRLLEAARLADIHRTVQENFQEGYETVIGERGVTLSGGQRQRVAIARALLGTPPILILDDSLSAVDAETDRRIQTALKNRHGQSTTFVISHRISTLSQADLVLVLENGHLTHAAPPDELAAQSGLYQRINDIQSQLQEDLSRADDASMERGSKDSGAP
ncbi:MAG: ABC transporter ATP-binding protein [Lentisphaeria bacterium]|nr:ABC transporter ATP-binding protein [Lentisphaeria bacterium]